VKQERFCFLRPRFKLEPFLRSLVARRVFALFITCALVPVVAIALLSFVQTSEVLRDQAFARLQSANRSYSTALHARILEAEEHLVAIADAIQRGRSLPDVGVVGGRTRFAAVRILRKEASGLNDEIPTLHSLTDSVWAHLARGESALVVEPLRESPIAILRYVDASAPERGVLVAELQSDYLWGPLEALPGAEIAAVADGQLLYSSDSFPEGLARRVSDGASSTGALEWKEEDDARLSTYRLLFLKPRFAHPGFTVVASLQESDALAALKAFQGLFPPVILLAVLAAMLLSITQLRRRMVPLEKLIEGTKEIGSGRFSTRVQVRSGDEFEMLAGSMNEMAERLESTDAERQRQTRIAQERQEQLIQADKMASLGILVSGVAHEVNNPNSLIRLNTQLLRDAWSDVDSILAKHHDEAGDFPLGAMTYSELATRIPTLLDDTLNGSDRITRIVDGLKDFARQAPAELSHAVDMNAVCRSAVKLVRTAIDSHTNHFSESYHPSPQPVRGDFQRLEQVVVNLLINACEALPHRDKALRLSTHGNADDGAVTVRVDDEGVGIPADALQHVTDPFFTSKRAEGGTGLGLSICATITKEHGGALRFAPREGGGTRAELTLPLSRLQSETW